jgi:hypothetical protein
MYCTILNKVLFLSYSGTIRIIGVVKENFRRRVTCCLYDEGKWLLNISSGRVKDVEKDYNLTYR